MDHSIRGIACGLCDGAIKELLLYLSELYSDFYIPWCQKIDESHKILPGATRDIGVSAQELRRIASCTIWELVLHIDPLNAKHGLFETYEDFAKSSCICCLIYYDCGYLDVYIKDRQLLELVHKKLRSLNAEDLSIITDTNDGRTGLSP